MRFRVLDSWRGVCALLVALGHFCFNTHLYDIPVVRSSYLCVDFFFVLSGFVISHAYLDRLQTLRHVGEFAVRRFGRLWPLHVSVLVALVAIELVKYALVHMRGVVPDQMPFTDGTSVAAIATNVLLIQALGIHATQTWNQPAWSISVEFYTYFVFAACCVAAMHLPRPKTALRVLGLAVIAISVLCLVLSPIPDLNETIGYAIFRCTYGFFVGYFVSELWKSGYGRTAVRGIGAELAAIALVVVVMTYGAHDRTSFVAPLVFALAVWVFAFERGAVSRLLGTPAFQALGRWSYSIYLVHWLLLNLFLRVFHAVSHRPGAAGWFVQIQSGGDAFFRLSNPFLADLLGVFYVALVIGTAALTYRFIEDPSRRFFNNLAKTKFSRSATG